MEEPAKVIYVDDDSEFTEDIVKVLEDRSFDVSTHTLASLALNIYDDDGDFDCIISDYNLLGMNGVGFLEEVRQRDPDLPFILFTADGDSETRRDVENGSGKLKIRVGTIPGEGFFVEDNGR